MIWKGGEKININIKKYAANTCPECGQTNWTTDKDSAYGLVKVDTKVSPIVIHPETVSIVNPVMCNNCGYTKLYLDDYLFHGNQPR
jgi:predicted nucleic-acid-binding Zn-ribbon protein